MLSRAFRGLIDLQTMSLTRTVRHAVLRAETVRKDTEWGLITGSAFATLSLTTSLTTLIVLLVAIFRTKGENPTWPIFFSSWLAVWILSIGVGVSLLVIHLWRTLVSRASLPQKVRDELK